MNKHETTAKELFVFINPAVAELRKQHVKGAVALDVARNIQIVRLAIEPIESVRQRVQDEMQAVETDKKIEPAERQQRLIELRNDFESVLNKKLKIGYWPLPYEEMKKTLEECPIGVMEALMFMLVTEGKKGE